MENSLGIFRLEISVCDLALGNLRLEIAFGDFRFRSFVPLRYIRLGTFVLELSSGTFRRHIPLGMFRLGTFV